MNQIMNQLIKLQELHYAFGTDDIRSQGLFTESRNLHQDIDRGPPQKIATLHQRLQQRYPAAVVPEIDGTCPACGISLPSSESVEIRAGNRKGRRYIMEEVSLNYEAMEWEETRAYPAGTLIKVLRRDEKGTPLTVLLKVKGGFEMGGHSHVGTEQHFVLEGEYESEGRIYGVGFYRLIPKETPHGPFKSEKGAVILVLWDAI